MTAPPLPDQPELFCVGCQQWKPRAQMVNARWVIRINGHRQAQYRCRPCQDALIHRQEAVRRGG